MNGIYDVYDYAFTMFQLDGGTKQSGEVSGQATLCAEKSCIRAGETVTIYGTCRKMRNMSMHLELSSIMILHIWNLYQLSERRR